MKSFLLFAFSLCFSAIHAQEIDLKNIEEAIKTPASGNYQIMLKEKGFHLFESANEGEDGIYEKWRKKENGLILCIQHSETFHFTKLTISSGGEASQETLDYLLIQITNSYGKKSFDTLEYYVKEGNPDTTVHKLAMAQGSSSVEGIMFFRKFQE